MRKLQQHGRKYPEDVRPFDYIESVNGIKGLVMRVNKTKDGEITGFKVIDAKTRQVDIVTRTEATDWENYYEYGQKGKPEY